MKPDSEGKVGARGSLVLRRRRQSQTSGKGSVASQNSTLEGAAEEKSVTKAEERLLSPGDTGDEDDYEEDFDDFEEVEDAEVADDPHSDDDEALSLPSSPGLNGSTGSTGLTGLPGSSISKTPKRESPDPARSPVNRSPSMRSESEESEVC